MHFEVVSDRSMDHIPQGKPNEEAEEQELPPTAEEEEKVRVYCDTYLFFSIALPDIFLLIVSGVKSLCDMVFSSRKLEKTRQRWGIFCFFVVILRLIWVLFLFVILLIIEACMLIPACITPLFQILFIVYLNQEIQASFQTGETNFLKIYQLKTVVVFN